MVCCLCQVIIRQKKENLKVECAANLKVAKGGLVEAKRRVMVVSFCAQFRLLAGVSADNRVCAKVNTKHREAEAKLK